MMDSAVLSADRIYRYSLTRLVGAGDGKLVFVMLNPSTADAETDDPTIRRCMGFARRTGAAILEVVNLFAYRSTDPAHLKDAVEHGIDPIGPENDLHIDEALRDMRTRHVVCAWGRHGGLRGRDAEVLRRHAGVRFLCLGLNADGSPKHPLYLRADAPLLPYPLRDGTP